MVRQLLGVVLPLALPAFLAGQTTSAPGKDQPVVPRGSATQFRGEVVAAPHLMVDEADGQNNQEGVDEADGQNNQEGVDEADGQTNDGGVSEPDGPNNQDGQQDTQAGQDPSSAPDPSAGPAQTSRVGRHRP